MVLINSFSRPWCRYQIANFSLDILAHIELWHGDELWCYILSCL